MGFAVQNNSANPAPPKADSIGTCFDRIAGLLSRLREVTDAIEGTATKLGGSWPQSGEVSGKTDAPAPSHMLFRAHGLENELLALISRQETALGRMNEIIG
jgi:hypothetical protein